jgi:hypothetical protein
MRIYLCGPMRGRSAFNFPAFHRGAAALRANGHEVFSPAEPDIERHCADISAGNHDGDEDVAAREHGFDLRVAFGEDPAWICAHADAVALLPGWKTSKGAAAERATAVALGLQVIELGTEFGQEIESPPGTAEIAIAPKEVVLRQIARVAAEKVPLDGGESRA